MNLCLPCVCLIPTSRLLPALWCSVLLDAGVSNCLLSRLPDCPTALLSVCLPFCRFANLPGSYLSACLSPVCCLPLCLLVYLPTCWLITVQLQWIVGPLYFKFSPLEPSILFILFVFFFVSIILVSSPQFLLRSMILARDQVSIFDNWGMCIPYVPWTCFEVLAPLAVNCPTLGVFYLVQRTACHWGDTEGLVMLCVWQSQSYSCGVLASWWIPEESHPGAKNVSSGRSSWVSHVALGGGRLEPF